MLGAGEMAAANGVKARLITTLGVKAPLAAIMLVGSVCPGGFLGAADRIANPGGGLVSEGAAVRRLTVIVNKSRPSMSNVNFPGRSSAQAIFTMSCRFATAPSTFKARGRVNECFAVRRRVSIDRRPRP